MVAARRHCRKKGPSTLQASHSPTFDYTGAEQTFEVPSGVTRVTVTASGASGGGGSGSYGVGANGGLVKARIPVRPGESLAIFVLGEGTTYSDGGGRGGEGEMTYLGPGGVGGGPVAARLAARATQVAGPTVIPAGRCRETARSLSLGNGKNHDQYTAVVLLDCQPAGSLGSVVNSYEPN